MIAVDTDIVVLYLVEDDVAQTDAGPEPARRALPTPAVEVSPRGARELPPSPRARPPARTKERKFVGAAALVAAVRAYQAAMKYGEAVQRGYVLGAANLGYLVLNGLGVPSDPGWARRLFKLVALELAMSPPETRQSRLRLAMPYREIPEELEDALRWVRDLEDAEPEQLYQLALRLKIGDSLPHHAKLARQWLERASGQGGDRGGLHAGSLAPGVT